VPSWGDTIVAVPFRENGCRGRLQALTKASVIAGAATRGAGLRKMGAVYGLDATSVLSSASLAGSRPRSCRAREQGIHAE